MTVTLELTGYVARNVCAAIVGLAIRPTSFRFSKDYRHGETRFHRAVYACCNTVAANYVAWGHNPLVAVFWGFAPQKRFMRKEG